MRPCSGGKISLDAGMQRTDEQVGKSGEHFAGLLRRKRSGQNASADQEHVFLAEQPDRIEHFLVAAGLAQRRGEIGLEPFGIGQRAEEARVDERIDDVRMLRENFGEPWRGAENERDEANEFRILPQQREQAPAGAQAGEKTVESGESRIRIFRPRELIDDDGNQLGQIFPRLFAAQGAIAAAVPAPHGGGNFARLAKAHFREPIERLAAGVALARRERQVLLLRKQGRRAFEQLDVMPFDRAQMRQQRGGELVAVLKAEKSGKLAERLALGRQRMRLLVRHHLQTMLDAAQEIVSRRQLVAGRGVDPAAGGERGRASRRSSGRAGPDVVRRQ